MNAVPLPLAEAAARMRGKAGRPPKLGPKAPRIPAQLGARLLDVPAAALYLNVSEWTIRDLVAAGTLARVRIPMGAGELRRVLLDRADLDDLVGRWKETGR